MNITETAKTHRVLDMHAGSDHEGKADMVFTFETFAEANDFLADMGARVASKRAARGDVKVPESLGGGWIDFPAKQVFACAAGRRIMVQVHVKQVSPYLRMSRKARY